MLDKSFGLLFYLKKPKGYERGDLPIYLRITINGKSKELSLKRKCDPGRWNQHAGRAIGTKENIKSLNNYLDTYMTKILEAKRSLIEGNKTLSATALKDSVTGNHKQDKMLISIFEKYNSDVKKLVGIDYSLSTWTKYDRTKRLIKEFVQWKYNEDDIHIQQLDFQFVSQCELYFKTERKCGHNTTLKYISILKMVVLYCVANRWLEYDPFTAFKMKKEEVDTTFLTQDEIMALIHKEIHIERLKRIRDVYIFCCFTGLSYADIEKLNRTEVSIGIDNELWIFTDRLKTRIKTRVPLLPFAFQIMKNYEHDPACIQSNKVLPVLCNQKYNAYLKELADICGITKRMTTHTARHTFGTTVTLNNGVPIESVSKMLGHKKIATTQHYAKILDCKVSADMMDLKQKLKAWQ